MRKRGERNWEDVISDCVLHEPVAPSENFEHTTIGHQEVTWVHGFPYIRAVDGALEPVS